MADDPVVAYLRSLTTSDRARSAAWDAVYTQDDETAQRTLQSLPFSDSVREDLWDLRRGGTLTRTPVAARTPTVEENAPATTPEGSALGRFGSNFAEQVNPISAVKGLVSAVVPESMGGTGLVNTARGMWNDMAEQRRLGSEALSRGDTSEGLGRMAAGMVPIFGPAAAESAQQMNEGDIAGGLGTMTGLVASAAMPRVRTIAKNTARLASSVAPKTMERVAKAAEAGAAERIADTIAPKVGRQKVRRGVQADRVAPALARDLAADGAPLSRQAFHADVSARRLDAQKALDEAADARLSARTFETQPIIDGLLEQRRRLTAESVDASRPVRSDGVAVPVGRDVVPGPNRARVAVIDQAIAEIKALGPVARYEPIRRIRQAYDGPAEVVYSPAVTPDYLTNRAGALGSADVTGVLRDQLATWDPATAAANATYSLYKTADDVLRATAEVERTRPRVGRQIMARLTGTLIGGQQGGIPGAVVGAVGGPMLDSALASGVTTKLKVARLQQRLADVIRSGNVQAVNETMSALEREVRAAARSATRTGAVQAGQADSANPPTP